MATDRHYSKRKQPQPIRLSPPNIKPSRKDSRNLSPLPSLDGLGSQRPGSIRHTGYNPPAPAKRPEPRPTPRPAQPGTRKTAKNTRQGSPKNPSRPGATPRGGVANGRKTKHKQGKRKSSIKRRIVKGFVTFAVFGAILFFIVFRFFSINAMGVMLGDMHIGYIQLDRELTSEAFQGEVIAHLEAIHGTGVVASQNVTVAPARWVAPSNISQDRRTILNAIAGQINYRIQARAIYVNGSLEGIVRSQNCINQIIADIQGPYRTENTVEAFFTNDWRIEYFLVDASSEEISTPLEVMPNLRRSVFATERYVVQPGDMLGVIAQRFNTSEAQIEALSNRQPGEMLRPGDVLAIPVTRPLLSVTTIDEVATYSEMEMQVEIRYSDNHTQDSNIVLVEGERGVMRSIERITSINGIVMEVILLPSEIVTEPVPRVIQQGTLPAVVPRR